MFTNPDLDTNYVLEGFLTVGNVKYRCHSFNMANISKFVFYALVQWLSFQLSKYWTLFTVLLFFLNATFRRLDSVSVFRRNLHQRQRLTVDCTQPSRLHLKTVETLWFK
jgi:hypothetical protein